MAEGSDEVASAARGIAFLLLRDAFLDLAEALVEAEPDAGPRLLNELQDRVAVKLAAFAAERPKVVRGDVLSGAAMQVREVLRTAQGLTDEAAD